MTGFPSSCFGRLDTGAAQALAGQLDAMGVMDEAVQDGAGVEGLEAEVVEDEEIGAAERLDEARMAAVATGERQVVAELRPAVIEDRAIVAAGSVADGAGEPALADAGRADEGRDCRGRRSIRRSRASGTARDRALGRRDSRRPRRSPAGGALPRAAVSSAACPCAMTSPCRGAGRASRRGRGRWAHRRRRDRRRLWPFQGGRGRKADRGWDV